MTACTLHIRNRFNNAQTLKVTTLTRSETISGVNVLVVRPLTAKLLAGVDDERVQWQRVSRNANIDWAISVHGGDVLSSGVVAIRRRNQR